MAMDRVVADFEAAYLSRNEDTNATHPRTMFIAKSGTKLPEIRFSTLGHRVLWADANESEQTVISYLAHDEPRRTRARSTGSAASSAGRRTMPPEDEPSDYDVLVHDIAVRRSSSSGTGRTLEWQDTWDTTQSDGQKGWLPSRVRITIVVKDPSDHDYKLTTEARILMQEPLNFVQ